MRFAPLFLVELPFTHVHVEDRASPELWKHCGHQTSWADSPHGPPRWSAHQRGLHLEADCSKMANYRELILNRMCNWILLGIPILMYSANPLRCNSNCSWQVSATSACPKGASSNREVICLFKWFSFPKWAHIQQYCLPPFTVYSKYSTNPNPSENKHANSWGTENNLLWKALWHRFRYSHTNLRTKNNGVFCFSIWLQTLRSFWPSPCVSCHCRRGFLQESWTSFQALVRQQEQQSPATWTSTKWLLPVPQRCLSSVIIFFFFPFCKKNLFNKLPCGCLKILKNYSWH